MLSPVVGFPSPSERTGVKGGDLCLNWISSAVCMRNPPPSRTPYDNEDLRVNTRAVLASRTAVCGRAGLATFAGMIGMVPPLTSKHYLAC